MARNSELFRIAEFPPIKFIVKMSSREIAFLFSFLLNKEITWLTELTIWLFTA